MQELNCDTLILCCRAVHTTRLYVDVRDDQWPIVYCSDYNISFLGLEKLHPFDAGKWGRVIEFLKSLWIFKNIFSFLPIFLFLSFLFKCLASYFYLFLFFILTLWWFFLKGEGCHYIILKTFVVRNHHVSCKLLPLLSLPLHDSIWEPVTILTVICNRK